MKQFHVADSVIYCNFVYYMGSYNDKIAYYMIVLRDMCVNYTECLKETATL